MDRDANKGQTVSHGAQVGADERERCRRARSCIEVRLIGPKAGPENLDVRSVTGGFRVDHCPGGMAVRHDGGCKGKYLVNFQVLYTLGEVRCSN